MKKYALLTLKIVVPISFGLLIVWFFYKDMTEQDKKDLLDGVVNANYWFIAVSLAAGILSHVSRAWRWGYLLETIGYKASLGNRFYSVMVGYFINLLLPRAGELSRCGFLYRYEKVPVNLSFGTVLAERAIDFAILVSISLITMAFQFDKLDELLESEGIYAKLEQLSSMTVVYFILGGILAFGLGYYLLKKIKFGDKIRQFLKGIFDGFKSVLKMEKKWLFILHTVIIWLLYIIMFRICFYAITGTAEVGFGGIFAGFVMGSLAIVFVQGGIGVYPVLITLTLVQYGISKPDGSALGWVIWLAQTAMIVIVGGLSFFLIQFTNSKNKITVDDNKVQSGK